MSNLTRVRRLIGDSDSSDYLLSDADIVEILTDNSDNVNAAAAEAARAIAAQLARNEDISINESSLRGGSAYQQYIALAEKLEKRAATANAIPFAGGISVADKESRETNTDRVTPAFSRALHRGS